MFSSEDELTKNNIYMAVFDFNKEKRHGKRLKALDYEFCDEFMNDFSIFLKEHPEFFSYIKANANTITDNKTEIKRTQISREEYAVLNSIKVKNNYERFIASLYIIGVAKNKTSTYKLNQISLDYFCPSNKSTAKKYVTDLFVNMGYIENQTFRFKDNAVFFKSEFVIEAQDKYASKEKRDFDEINSFLNSKSEEKTVKKEVIEKIVEPVKPIKEEKQDYLAQQIVANYNPEAEDDITRVEREEKRRAALIKIKSVWNNYYFENIASATKKVQEWSKIFDYNAELEKIQKKFNVKSEIIDKALNDGYFDDKDGGLDMKKNILASLKELRNQLNLMVRTENIFGDDKFLFMGYMYKTHAEFMAL